MFVNFIIVSNRKCQDSHASIVINLNSFDQWFRAKHERENNNEETDNPDVQKIKKSKKVSDLIQELIEKEGPKGFYKGVLPYFIGTLASFGVYFFWYHWLLRSS